MAMTPPDIDQLTTADVSVFPEPVTTVEGEFRCDVCGRSDFKNGAGVKRHKTITHGKNVEGLSVTRRVQRDVSGKGAPTVDQLTKATGRLLGYGTIAMASVVVDSDPRPLTETDKDNLIDALSAQPGEAEDIMRPLARIFAGTTLNKRVGRRMVDNMDAADSVLALVMMTRRWSQYMAERKQSGQSGVSTQSPVQRDTVQVTTQPPPTVRPPTGTPVPERQGILVTPDMIRR